MEQKSGKLGVFNFISVDGYFKGPNGDISWAKGDKESSDYSAQQQKGETILLFGRVTYEMMASFWPTPMAKQLEPATAEGMNRREKIVFSKTLKSTTWNNTRIVSENIFEEVKKLKQAGKNLTLLGSGSLVTQFSDQGLVDEYQLMIKPIALGSGTSIFTGLKKSLNLNLVRTKQFKNGTMILTYQPLG